MSSLSTDQQWREIEDNRRFLKQFENIQKSDIFSVPFGGDQDYNNLTRDMAIQSGHTGLLLSRNRLQKSKKNEGQSISLKHRPDDVSVHRHTVTSGRSIRSC